MNLMKRLFVSTLLLLAAGSSCVFGQGAQRQAIALGNVNSQARILAYAQVKVCSYNAAQPTSCPSLVTVYQDPALTIPYASNPIQADKNGNYSYWVTPGNYVEVMCATGTQCQTQVVTLGGAGGGGGGSTHSPINSIQVSDGAGGHNSDTSFTIDPTTHSMSTSGGNLLIGALSSVPRADFDPMDTKYLGGLAAAIAGTSGFTPTQVINAAIDAGQCSAILNSTPFHAVNIPLPNGVTFNVTGIKLWGGTSIGGSSPTNGPNLQHNDSSQAMIIGHAAGDALVCNGTTYHPAAGGVGSVFIHDIGIGGMFAPATNTDIGVELNMFSSAAVRIRGFGNAFGSSAVLSNGTSTFLSEIGYPGSQVQGCKTYNTGVLPVSGYTAGLGVCGAAQDVSTDGGATNIYASDGQAFATNHAAGPCYPNCAAFVASGNGTYDTNIFVQISGIGVIIAGSNNKLSTIRVDFTSREAIRFITAAVVNTVAIDSSCTDKALQTNWLAGLATSCFAVSSAAATNLQQLSVFNNAGIFDFSFYQAWIKDGSTGGSGVGSVYGGMTYQGNPANATANGWLIAGEDNSQIGAKVVYPAMPPMSLSTGSTINASGVTAVTLASNITITSIIGGSAGQRLTIVGNGTVQQNSQIFNLNGLNSTVTCSSGDGRSCPNALEYVATAGNLWVQIAGPPNQTPTHVNYAGNPTPTAPSLVDVYGNIQPRPAPAFSILATMQLHGTPSGSGQACFEQVATFPDNSYIVSDLQCTTVNLTLQTAGEIFTFTTPQAVMDLYLVSNTEGNGVPIGKYPRQTSLWDGPTVVSLGGDGTTAPTANLTNTGQSWSPVTLVVGTKFTTSGCGISSTAGGATAGTFTLGANSCTTVVTFNGATGTAAKNGWTCQAHDRTAPTVLIGGESSSTITTASIPIPAGAGATDVISFRCVAF